MKSYMYANEVGQYFIKKGFSANFWNDLEFINGQNVIPCSAIKAAIGEVNFKKMESEVTVWIPESNN